jgi:serine phosphatase RsbU (regulator of sigma subunit)
LDLNLDEKLVLYSDGVTETFGESDLMFGDESLHDFLKTQCNLSANELPILLEQNLDNFRREKELSDDTSFIAIELLS